MFDKKELGRRTFLKWVGAGTTALVASSSIGKILEAGQTPPKPSKITVANYGTLKYDPAVVKNVPRYEKRTGIKLDMVEVPDETMFEDITRSLALGETTYQIFNIENCWTVDFARAGWISSFEEIGYEYPKDTLEALTTANVESLTYNGQLFAAPQWGNTLILIWRKSMFEDAGLEPEKAPETWEEFEEYAYKLKEALPEGKYPTAWVGSIRQPGNPTFLQWLYACGGRLFDPDVTTVLFNNKAGVEALAFLKKLVDEELTPHGVMNFTEGDIKDKFMAGTYAMTTREPWMVRLAYEKFGDDLGWGLYPTKPGVGEYSVAGRFDGIAWAINKLAPENVKWWAADFGAFYDEYKSQFIEAYVEGNSPARVDVFDDPKIKTEVPWYQVYKKSVKMGIQEAFPHYLWFRNRMVEAEGEAVSSPLEPRAAAKKALDKMAKEAEEVFGF